MIRWKTKNMAPLLNPSKNPGIWQHTQQFLLPLR